MICVVPDPLRLPFGMFRSLLRHPVRSGALLAFTGALVPSHPLSWGQQIQPERA